MFKFLKKLFGFDSAESSAPSAPYKIETPAQCSDSVTQPDGNECKSFPTAVNNQITDAVTQAPAEKPAENPAQKTKPRQGQKKPAAKQGQKKPAPQSTGQKPNGQRRGRKPKAKPAQ